jgi:tetratricopeptide (TPR) repeat protein
MLEKFERDEGIRHFQRGVALERVNRILEAVEEYRQAIARYPHLREAHAALGFYYQRNGLLAKAAEEFHIVANLEGDFLSYFNLGHLLVELERYDEALDAFHHCLNLDPADAATHYEVAFIHYVHGAFKTALEHVQIPLQNYPEDWEVLNLLGKCHLGAGEYDDALHAFGKALLLSHTPEIEANLLDNIATVERHREFITIENTKDRLYAQEGVVYLGSAQDNGLATEEVADYHFTYPDIAVTLQRFMALQRACQWNFTALVATDKVSQPLALALGDLLDVPVRQVANLKPNDIALLVMAVAREVELLVLTLDHMPCRTITFCLGLNWLRHSPVLPDVTGIVARTACSVPWEPELRRLCADGASPEPITMCSHHAAAEICLAVNETPLDTNLQRQVRYYTCYHRRLSFSPIAPYSHPTEVVLSQDM